jgi:hypothetical protein
MKRSWELKPNLLDCILEERIAPAIANLGVIALTTGGYSLVTPFPGASNSSAGSLGSSSTGQSSAASVSGAAMPTSFYVTGNRGISTFLPGNFTGNPAIGGAVTGGGGLGLTIQVGSGADEDGGPSPSPSAARSTGADGGTTAPIMAYIGQVSSYSGSDDTPAGQSSQTQTQSAPVPSLPPMGVVIPGSPSGTSPGMSSPMNPMTPQMGAPTLMPGLGRGLAPSLPGGMGVQGSLFPSGMGGN